MAKAGDGKSWVKAVDRAESALEAGGNSAALRGFYVLALYRANKKETALSQARAVVRDFPDSYLCQYLGGKILLEMDASIDALPPLRRAHELEPDNVNCLTLLAICAMRQNVNDAESCFEALLDSKQDYLAANGMGVYFVNQGRYPESMSWFSRASTMTDNPGIYLNMGVLCDRYMKKPQLARPYYVKFMLEAQDRFPDKTALVKTRLRQLFTPN